MVTKKKIKKKPIPVKIGKDSNSEGHEGSSLSENERSLLKLLKKSAKTLTWLSNHLSMSKTAVVAIADKLTVRGYDIRFKDDYSGERTVFIKTDENLHTDSIKITEVSRKVKIAFISEVRMGTYQAQISMLHWLYKEVFERENVNFVVVVGGLVVGKPIPTIRPDVLISNPDELVSYVVDNFPNSTKFKTYIVGGRRELSMRGGEGYDVIKAICSAREDLAAAGELERTFDVRGVKIRVMSIWDDNSPKVLSYGVEKITLQMNPAPDIAVFGGNHERMEIPAYGKGPTLAITVPSLHTQMRRQARKGITPRLGCTIVELSFEDGIEERKINMAKDVNIHHINLDDYAICNDWAKGIDDVDLSNITNGGRLVMGWLLAEGAISGGELSRRLALHGVSKSKLEVKELIKRLYVAGANIQYQRDEKRYRITHEPKDRFRPTSIKYEDLFSSLTKGASLACTHLNSIQEMPEVLKVAFEEATRDGVRAFYHAGDVTDGAGSCGYRGHDKDVKYVGVDQAADHCISVYPKPSGRIVATEERPLSRFAQEFDEKGRLYYKCSVVKDGSHLVQAFIIDGNHDAWSRTAFGYSPVRNMAMRMQEQLVFLGAVDGSITEDGSVEFDGVFNRLIHGGGGLGSLSGKAQKFLAAHRDEGLGKGFPNVLHIGNWHTAFMLFQNELVILDACFKYKDAFHARLALVSKVGLHVYELFGDKARKNITRVISNFRNYRPLAHELMNKTVK